MIVILLIAFAVLLNRREAQAWQLLMQARTHEAVGNPQLPGHAAAMDWVDKCDTAAKQAQARTKAVEGMTAVLGRWVLILLGGLSVVRIGADAMAAAASAVSDAAGVAGWTVVVDGLDTLLWLVAVV